MECRCHKNLNNKETETKESDGQSYSVKAPKWVVHSGELFKGNREVLIVHGSQEYRLMVTKANKLLLIK